MFDNYMRERFPITPIGRRFKLEDRRQGLIVSWHNSMEAAEKAWKRVVVAEQKKAPPKPSEHDFSGTNDDWEERVFINAEYFTVIKGRHPYLQRKEVLTWPEARDEAAVDPLKLVYVVTASGRSVCLVRKRWDRFNALWEQYHGGTEQNGSTSR